MEKIENQLFSISVKYSNYIIPENFLTREDLKVNDKVLVLTNRGLEIGSVTKILKVNKYNNTSFIQGLPSKEDVKVDTDNKKFEKKLIQEAQELADANGLIMHFIAAEYTLDRKTLNLFFEAENRVDFRNLLKDLAKNFSCKIELTQIGSRVSAGFKGGLGVCGHSLCCATFLKKFDAVSLNRAKNQNLSLNTQKLSGNCGRLKCCLCFEDDTYTEEKKKFPKIGYHFTKENKKYTITGYNIFSKLVKCDAENEVSYFPLEEVKKYL